MGLAANSEVEVLQFKGLGLGFWSGGEGALCWAEEPEEGDDDEVDNVGVCWSVIWVSGVKDVPELSQDSGVDWVGAAWGIVVVGESFEESRV